MWRWQQPRTREISSETSCGRGVSFCLGTRHEEISAAADGFDPVASVGAGKLLADVTDMDVDDTIERTQFAAEDGFSELLARDDLAGAFHQHFKHGKFSIRQAKRGALNL